MTTQFVYDNYEISGCYRLNDEGEPDPDGSSVERCDDDSQAQFWTLYGHIDGQGAQAIGDFPSRADAEQVYRRIVGEPFTGSYEAGARLRLMHAAPELLAACQLVVARLENGDLAEPALSCAIAVHQATEACPPWVSAEPDIQRWLARTQRIASIWCVEDMQCLRPDLNARETWEVLKAASHHEDANVGINWDVLGSHAEILYGRPPETDDSEEG